MKRTAISLGLFTLLLASAFTINENLKWSITQDYEIRFKTSSAKGTFSNLTGTVIFDQNNLSAAQMNVSVDVNTIDTGNKTKDKHARGKSWFNEEKYPKISFQSTSFQKTGTGYNVSGNLQIRDVTKSIEIPFTFKETSTGGLFVGSFKVKRKDYNINGPWLSNTMVGKTIQIDLRVPVQK